MPKKFQEFQGEKIFRPFENMKWQETAKFGLPIQISENVYITAFKTPLNEKNN